MANLTLSIDDEVLKRARIRALEHGTSVNAVVREHLSNYADAERARQAMEAILEIAEGSESGSGPEGRAWTREDLYEERIGRWTQ